VGVQLVQVLANAVMILAGVWLLAVLIGGAGRRWTRALPPRLAAVLGLAFGAGAEMQLSWSSGSGGEMALSMAATKLLHLDSAQYDAILGHGMAVSVAINLALVALPALLGLALALPFRPRSGARRARLVAPLGGGTAQREAGVASLGSDVAPVPAAATETGAPAAQTGSAAASLGDGVAARAAGEAPLGAGEAPLGAGGRRAPAAGQAGWTLPARLGLSAMAVLALLYGSVRPAVAFDEAHEVAAPAAPRQTRLAAMVESLPSVVTITPAGNGWVYAVNGRREVVKGFGYNPVVGGDSTADRAALYDRDFQAMAQAGANTIVGWDEPQFDELLMSKAAQYGLGVILPFDLGPGLAYEDPVEREQLTATVLQRVRRFQNSPALRMWGLGNEVLHEILRAHGTEARYEAAAQFIVQTADRIHELDPNHPVVYRDAEDWYIKPVIKALSDGVERPWFVYSMNFFTTRMRDALTSGPAHTQMHQPLMISEYGPVGLRPENRPAGYRQLWDIIREHPDTVLGGLAYVWTTNGPEPLDRSFGLTDAYGQPVDGALAELASLYTNET
jgi:glycosyl hydrolase family 2